MKNKWKYIWEMILLRTADVAYNCMHICFTRLCFLFTFGFDFFLFLKAVSLIMGHKSFLCSLPHGVHCWLFSHCTSYVIVANKVLPLPSRCKELFIAPDTTQLKQAVREAARIFPRPLQVDLWPFELESGVRVTCDVGYLCANFSLSGPLCSRLRPDVRDRLTSDAHHRLMPLP